MEIRNESSVKRIELVSMSNKGIFHRWKAKDIQTGIYTIIKVSSIGEVTFNVFANSFPYSEAFNELVKLEGRKLIFKIRKNNEKYRRIIEGIVGIQKIPCIGVEIQMYYLNP